MARDISSTSPGSMTQPQSRRMYGKSDTAVARIGLAMAIASKTLAGTWPMVA